MSFENNVKAGFKAVCDAVKSAIFLPAPTHNFSSAHFFYFGWSDTGLIHRQKRSDASTQSFKSNDFTSDWKNRENLGYS